MNPKAVIFDLDGTLVYTLPEYRRIIVEDILQELGIAECPEGFVDKFWFFGNRATLIRNELRIDPKSFFKVYNHHDTREGREAYSRTFEDTEYLQQLKGMGYKLGVVTGGSPHVMDVNINLLGRDLFDAVVSANPHAQPPLSPKPDPVGLRRCLELLGASPDQACYIGNGDEDVGAAQNAGVLDILILRGEHQPPNVNVSYQITALPELESILENHLPLRRNIYK